MSKKEVDPNEGLAADAVLAEDLGDEEERRLAQIAEMGGEIDDIDSFDATGLDDGSDLNFTPPEKEDDKADDEAAEDAAKDEKTDDDAEADPDTAEADGEDDKADVSDDDAEADDEPVDKNDDDDEPEPKVQGIPKHRFDQVNDRAKAAEAELARRDAEAKAATEAAEDVFDFDAKEKEYMEQLLDGKTDEALATRKEINAAQETKWKSETSESTRADVHADANRAELNSLSVQAEQMYPVFDPEHADFDRGMTDRVLAYYQGYAASGQAKTQGDAFVMALADVIQQEKLDDVYGDGVDEKKVETPEEKVVEDPKAEKKRKDKEALADKTHTPISGEGAAADSSGVVAPDIDKMTDDELDALPAKTLARLRGDFV